MLLFVMFVLVFISYGYAAFNTDLSISGEAQVRIDADIRITDIKMVGYNNMNETFQSDYSKDTITMGVNLLDSSSSVTYEYTIVNKTNKNYVITDIIELKSNENVSYTNTATQDMVIPPNTSQKFQIALNTYMTSQQVSLSLQFVFALDDVTAPVITGGSSAWSTTNKTISIATPGTATSGVKNYEYYVSNVATPPGDSVTGTTSNSVTVSNDGTYYLFYRTVSNYNVKSDWTAYQTVKIDKKTPVLTMKAAGQYEMSDGSNIASTTFGVSGGTTSCVNVTNNSSSVTTFQDIKGFGNYAVKCTATGNNGESVTDSKTYAMGGTLNANYGLSCGVINDLADRCDRDGTSWIVYYNDTQYGPYFQATEGCYKVVYSGSGLNNSDVIYQSYQHKPYIAYALLSLNKTSSVVSYYVKASEFTNGTGIEFVLINQGTTAVRVDSVKIQSVGTCPSS